MFWKGDCSSARALGLIRAAAAIGEGKHGSLLSVDMDQKEGSAKIPCLGATRVALVLRSSCTSPQEGRYHKGDPQRRQAQAKIKQLGKCPAPLLMPEQWHEPSLVTPSYSSSLLPG